MSAQAGSRRGGCRLRLHVGNLPFAATEKEVRELFARFGAVGGVSLVSDRDSGRPCGFGFVEIAEEAAGRAISRLDGSPWRGRLLRVNEARRRSDGGDIR